MVLRAVTLGIVLLAGACADPSPLVCPLQCSIPPESSLPTCSSVTKYSVCQSSSSWENQDSHVARYLEGIGVSAASLSSAVELGKKSNLPSPPSDEAVAAGACASSLLSLLCMSTFQPCEIGTETKSVCRSACAETVSACALSPAVASLPPSFCSAVLGFSAGSGVDEVGSDKMPDAPGCVPLSYKGANHLMWIAGFTIAALFSFLAALGLNLQKLSMSREALRRPLTSPRRPPLRQPLWFLGMSLITCGSLLDFVAFGLAPASLLAPLGALSLVWNMYLAPAFNGERLSRESARATAIICLGTLMTVVFAAHATPTYTLEDLLLLYREPVMVLYVLGVSWFLHFLFKTLKSLEIGSSDLKKPTTGNKDDVEEGNPLLPSRSFTPSSYDLSSPSPAAVAASSPLPTAKVRPSRSDSSIGNSSFASASAGFLAAAASTPSKAHAAVSDWASSPSLFESSEMKRTVCYGGIAGVFGGFSVLLGKSTAELIKNVMTGEDDGAFKHVAPYAIIGGMLASLLTQITILNKGLSKFNALLMVPVYQSFWNTSSVLGGIIYFQEYRDMGAFQALFFALGILVTLVGVERLLRERLNDPSVGGPMNPKKGPASTPSADEGSSSDKSNSRVDDSIDDGAAPQDWNGRRGEARADVRGGAPTPPHGAIELKAV